MKCYKTEKKLFSILDLLQDSCSEPSFPFLGLLYVDAGGGNTSAIENQSFLPVKKWNDNILCDSIW